MPHAIVSIANGKNGLSVCQDRGVSCKRRPDRWIPHRERETTTENAKLVIISAGIMNLYLGAFVAARSDLELSISMLIRRQAADRLCMSER